MSTQLLIDRRVNFQRSHAYPHTPYFYGLFLACSIAALTLYLRPSGSVQPAHLALIVFSISYLTLRSWKFEFWSLIFAGLFLYVGIVESFYYAFQSVTTGLINSAFFFYNFTVTLAIYAFTQKFGPKSIVYGIYGATLSIFFQLLTTGFDLRGIDAVERTAAGFNNPNQLGFFSCILLSFGYLFYRSQVIPYLIAIAFFASSLLFSILSLSKAALIANFIVILIALKPQFSKKSISLWILVSCLIFFTILWFVQKGAFDNYLFFSRLTNALEENDSSPESRGYLVQAHASVLQVLFGLGSENVHSILGHEIHSTPASILGNYGALGLAIFSGLIFSWIRRLLKGFGFVGLVSIAAPSLLYGLTHNGTRFTFFWILFATSLALATTELNQKKSQVHN